MPIHDAGVSMDDISKSAGAPNKVEHVKALSLDQCFLSVLALNPKSDSGLARLKAVLLKAVASRRLVVPSHVQETVFESSQLPAKQRDAVLELQHELSNGIAFLPFEEILCLETLSLVRPTVSVCGYRIEPLRINKSIDHKKLAEENRKAKTEVVARMNQVPCPPKSYEPNHGHDDIFHNVSKERSASMFRIVQEILVGRPLSDGTKVWEYTVGVGEFLLRERISRLECHNLSEKILNQEWEMMPIVGFHTILWSKIEQDFIKTNRTFKPNDILDILRLTVALLYADAVACDTPMKELVRQTKLDECVAVFSMRDVGEFTKWVESL